MKIPQTSHLGIPFLRIFQLPGSFNGAAVEVKDAPTSLEV